MDLVSAETFLRDQVPVQHWSLIPTTLRTAYATVKLMVEQEPVLNVCSAVDNRGRVITWAVDLAFEKLLQTQQLPFEYRWCSFEQPTGRYLEIRPPHSVLTISQVADPKRQPRNVAFRANKRFNNQPFFDLEEFKDERHTQGVPHFLILHGHQELHFAHLAVPHPSNLRCWSYKTPNLMDRPHLIASDLPETEPTDFEAIMTLKGEIERWRHDNDG